MKLPRSPTFPIQTQGSCGICKTAVAYSTTGNDWGSCDFIFLSQPCSFSACSGYPSVALRRQPALLADVNFHRRLPAHPRHFEKNHGLHPRPNAPSGLRTAATAPAFSVPIRSSSTAPLPPRPSRWLLLHTPTLRRPSHHRTRHPHNSQCRTRSALQMADPSSPPSAARLQRYQSPQPLRTLFARLPSLPKLDPRSRGRPRRMP